MDNNALETFLEDSVLHEKVVDFKQFSKGHNPTFYLKLASGTKLTLKLYISHDEAERCFLLLSNLGQNKNVAIPRFYDKIKRFFYNEYSALLFYFIEGSEISSVRLNQSCFKEIAEMYAQFQKCEVKQVDLPREADVMQLIAKVKEVRDIAGCSSKNFIKRYLYSIVRKKSLQLADIIAKEYPNHQAPVQQLIHGDISKPNMLFHQGKFVSFIDMDSVCYSWVGRDFAEFIVSSVLRYPLGKSKTKSIRQWYQEIHRQFGLSYDEYKYGLDVYYLYRLRWRMDQYQKKFGVCKFFNFLTFLSLRKCILKELKNLEGV